MNMIMDNSAPPHQQPQLQQHLLHHQHLHHQQPQALPPMASPQRADLKVSTSPPRTLSPSHNSALQNNNNNNNNNETPTSPQTGGVGKTGLKRSFDVAFLMMPDERIKQKQAEKQARLSEALERPQYLPTDLSPRQVAHQQQHHQQHLQLLHEQAEFFQLQEARRYPQITIRSPRVYDDPSVVIPDADALSLSPIKSAFTKVVQARLVESPGPQPQPPPALSPDQLSCPSLSPPVATPPPRTNSGNGSLSNGSTGNGCGTPTALQPQQLHPNVVYQSFRPEYSFNGAFHSVNQVQALQAAAAQNQRIKQQLFYRPPLGAPSQVAVPVSSAGGGGGATPAPPPPGAPEFLPGYPGFPFAPGAAHHFAAIAPPEMPRLPLQNPAAAAILSTLIPPTLASTFTLTAQNVCAKCNISFRMTSDLVYHMRSHHKSEVACDPNRRKREEKLKCPVCNESFRERHHLTRHMTAHQDKESDAATPPAPAQPAASEPIIHVGGGGGGASSRHHARAAAASK